MTKVRMTLAMVVVVFLPLSLASGQDFGAGAAGAAEGGAAVDAAPRALMQAIDLDGNGTIDAKELRAALRSLRKLDKNRDGQLTPDELVVAPAAGAAGDAAGKAGRRRGAAAKRGFGGAAGATVPGFGNAGAGKVGGFGGMPAGAGRAAGRAGSGMPLSTKQLLAFDKNGDHKISQQELPAQLWALYGRFDINRDGSLELIEIRRAASVK